MASIRTAKLEDETEAAATAADVQQQLEKLSQDIGELTKIVAAFGNAKVKEAGDRATELKDEVTERSAMAFEATRSSLVSMEEDLEAQIRAKPLQAVAIAAGVGFIAAMLTRR